MRTAIAFVLLTGCAADASEPPSLDDRLQGRWVSELAQTNGACAQAFVFDAPTFERDLICALEDGTGAIEGQLYEYELDGNRMVATPVATSCADDPGELVVTLELLSDDVLRVANTRSVVVLDRLDDDVPADGSNGDGSNDLTITFGCFDAEGAFEPRELREL